MNIRSTNAARSAPRARADVPQPPATARRSTKFVSPEVRRDIIAQAAYLRAQQRGFEPGHELEDWLAAEAETDAALAIGLPSAAD
jgi:Protein of unknown function (DUF2934)